jgi:hypothetical protein
MKHRVHKEGGELHKVINQEFRVLCDNLSELCGFFERNTDHSIIR